MRRSGPLPSDGRNDRIRLKLILYHQKEDGTNERSKVPYVDPPQLNAIRHAKFRTQKVLFRAVPSRYL
eukprot:SAG11_NODE_18588_length_485_cov_2.883721_1_plen_67_part_10